MQVWFCYLYSTRFLGVCRLLFQYNTSRLRCKVKYNKGTTETQNQEGKYYVKQVHGSRQTDNYLRPQILKCIVLQEYKYY